MQTRRFLNQTQPQTLQISVFLLYIDAFFLLFTGLGSFIGLAVIVGSVAAGYGIANERKWGYVLGVAAAIFGLYPYVRAVLSFGPTVLFASLSITIGVMIAAAKLALLLHPQSRDYQRIWFK